MKSSGLGLGIRIGFTLAEVGNLRVLLLSTVVVDITCVCVGLELSEQFDDMLKRNSDVVKEAIRHLNSQTSQRPMETE